MKILFVIYDNGSYIGWFPQGIAYITSYLEREGYHIDIYHQEDSIGVSVSDDGKGFDEGDTDALTEMLNFIKEEEVENVEEEQSEEPSAQTDDSAVGEEPEGSWRGDRPAWSDSQIACEGL